MKLEGLTRKMSRIDLEKWVGLTPKNGKVWLKNERDWLGKVERIDPKKWEGLTRKMSRTDFEKSEGLIWKVRRTHLESEKDYLKKWVGLTLNMKCLSQNRKVRFKNMTGLTQKKKVLLAPHSRSIRDLIWQFKGNLLVLTSSWVAIM